MITIKFNDVDIYKEYKVVLENFNIGIPEPKLTTLSIPGRDGGLLKTTAKQKQQAYMSELTGIPMPTQQVKR